MPSLKKSVGAAAADSAVYVKDRSLLSYSTQTLSAAAAQWSSSSLASYNIALTLSMMVQVKHSVPPFCSGGVNYAVALGACLVTPFMITQEHTKGM